MRSICWFSCGVSSCVAAFLEPEAELIRIKIDDEHDDNDRFVAEVESVLGRKVTTIQSPFRSVSAVVRNVRYINGVAGAPCTRILKRAVRERWEYENPGRNRYIWGFDADEEKRLARLSVEHENHAPLIDRNLTKAETHGLFLRLFPGVERPAMYRLGFGNNNCVGCVKGSRGYWNRIREVFPDVFAARAKLEREIGACMLRGGGRESTYLDELDPNVGRCDPIVPTCGLACFAEL